ncbi:hypothetical protein HDK64DRAFT_271608 [Phyllosticta capitalensis]
MSSTATSHPCLGRPTSHSPAFSPGRVSIRPCDWWNWEYLRRCECWHSSCKSRPVTACVQDACRQQETVSRREERPQEAIVVVVVTQLPSGVGLWLFTPGLHDVHSPAAIHGAGFDHHVQLLVVKNVVDCSQSLLPAPVCCTACSTPVVTRLLDCSRMFESLRKRKQMSGTAAKRTCK